MFDFEPAAPVGCRECVEGVKFGGFDPFNPQLSFCECSEGQRLAGVDAVMIARLGGRDGHAVHR